MTFVAGFILSLCVIIVIVKEMEELPEELTLRQKLRQFAADAVDYIFRQVLLVDLVIMSLVLVSFLFSGGFSAIALSERVFWVALFVMMVGTLVAVAALFTGKSFGIPLLIRKPEEARLFLDRGPEMYVEKEKRYNVGVRLWLIGLGCIALSALVERLFA